MSSKKKYFEDPEMFAHYLLENPRLQEHPDFIPWGAQNPHLLGAIMALGNRMARGEEEIIPLRDHRCSYCFKCGGHEPGDEKMKCSGCKKVLYCNRTCHKKHWRFHKKVCHQVDVGKKAKASK